jgi:hypothetical protein
MTVRFGVSGQSGPALTRSARTLSRCRHLLCPRKCLSIGGGLTAATGADPRQPGSPNYGGPQLQRRPSAPSQPQGAVGARRNHTEWQPLWPAADVLEGHGAGWLAGQKANPDAASRTVQDMANQPDEATLEAPIEAKRTALAQPIDTNQAQCKPGVGRMACSSALADAGLRLRYAR